MYTFEKLRKLPAIKVEGTRELKVESPICIDPRGHTAVSEHMSRGKWVATEWEASVKAVMPLPLLLSLSWLERGFSVLVAAWKKSGGGTDG